VNTSHSVSLVVVVGIALSGIVAGCTTLLGDYTVAPDTGDASNGDDGSIDAAPSPDSAPDSAPVADSAADVADSAPDVDACVPETDAELCTKAGANCGGIIAMDRCGASRPVMSCGTCTLPQTCNAQTPNVCGCVAESDTAFCTRLGKNCGMVTAPDNCGTQRSVQSCGMCGGGQTCGPHVANVCGTPVCTPETDAAFCTSYGATCGPLTNVDNCGTQRMVQSCGSCNSPQTCGAVSANQCGCVKESDATFCARLGHTCGSLAGADNCGMARTVASCGTCLATNSCSANGICVCGNFAACTAGQTCCSNGCFNVGSDPNNCAACGMSCGAGDAWECYMGGCGCGVRGNGHVCGSSCVNFQTNTNCTGCGVACDVAGGDWCCTLQGGTVYACRYGGDCAR
jgi:hypothetical protein